MPSIVGQVNLDSVYTVRQAKFEDLLNISAEIHLNLYMGSGTFSLIDSQFYNGCVNSTNTFNSMRQKE